MRPDRIEFWYGARFRLHERVTYVRERRRRGARACCIRDARAPQRIVCLTEEPTEVLYALGEEHRIVGISGFTVRPPRARKEKPKVSAFTSAKIDAILALEPDFVIGFSDIQADIARDLIRAGVEVWISNHRSVEGILDYIVRLGALVDAAAAANAYAAKARSHLADVERAAAKLPRRPRVYFEEWDEPPITGIRWVAELIRIAGGDDVFPERAAMPLARDRILADAGRGRASRAGHRARLMVRQEIPARSCRGAAGLVDDSGGARRRAARDQVADHPAAGARGAVRRARCDACALRGVGAR